MAILVQKYGGSSVADTDKLKEVARKVVETKRRGYDMVVVVSAMGDTTDDLLALARQITTSPNRRELDMLVSVGERVSMALLSMAIHDLGEQAISFTGSQAGIITNATQGAARVIEVRPYRVLDELEQGHIVIVAGYQGVSYKREVTTLGRGGSDTTAVALAAALSAEACEIYSDVEGVYSTDPRVVVTAKQLERVSFEEMQEMARLGAKVLNPDAVEFARRAGIALYARATRGAGMGTEITRPDGFPEPQLRDERAAYVAGVAGRRDVLLIELDGPSTGEDRSRDLLDRLSHCDILFATTRSGRDSTLVLLSTENLSDPDSLVSSVRDEFIETIGVLSELGLVSAVGSGVGNRTVAAVRLLRCLDAADIPTRYSFSTRTAVSAVVDVANVDRAMAVVHDEFME